MSRKNRRPKVLTSLPPEAGDLEQPKPMSTAEFWAGSFGDEYGQRNQVEWAERVPFWQRIVDLTHAQSFLDVGCNAAWNLLALRSINADFMLSGVDLNKSAVEAAQAKGLDVVQLHAADIAGTFGRGTADLVVTSGVLIHVHPKELRPVMQAIVDVSAQYVLAVEYFSAEEQAIEYRGYSGKLWKRPWAKLYEELGLSLVEFGEVAQGYRECGYCLMERHA